MLHINCATIATFERDLPPSSQVVSALRAGAGQMPDNIEGTSTSADGVAMAASEGVTMATSEGVTTRGKHRSKVRVNGGGGCLDRWREIKT